MNYNDIKINEDRDFVISFGGGCLILTCKKCGKDIGAEEVGFPGTSEQQQKPRGILEIKKQNHQCI